MPSNLPPIFPTSGIKAPTTSVGGIHRAQDFSTTRLNQHKERDEATVSIGRAIDRTESEKGRDPATSITHATEKDRHTTSAQNMPVNQYSGYGEEDEEIRNRLRYQYIRKLIRERKETEDTTHGA